MLYNTVSRTRATSATTIRGKRKELHGCTDRVKRGVLKMYGHELPAFNYCLDESDPDVVILRLQDGSFVAAFSASGATREGILEAAKEDYRERLRAHASRQGHGIQGQRSDQSA